MYQWWQLREVAERRDWQKRVKAVWREVPETRCRRRGLCCRESPPMHLGEYLVLFSEVMRWAPQERERVLARVWDYYFFAFLDESLYCPFYENKGCLIYSRRPLVCRLWGLLEVTEHRRREMLAAQEQRRAAFRARGIELPATSVGRALPECPYVKDKRGRPVRLSEARVAKLEGRLAELDREILVELGSPPGAVWAHCYLPSPSHLANSALGPEPAYEELLRALRHYQADPVAARNKMRGRIVQMNSALARALEAG